MSEVPNETMCPRYGHPSDFGERYLVPRIGRWASPDPLHVHASGGGEALNSYHYVGGNLLQARDPLGLDIQVATWQFDQNSGNLPRNYRTAQPLDLSTDHGFAEAAAIVDEMRAGVRMEWQARADEYLARQESRAASGRDVDMDRAFQTYDRIVARGDVEANAINIDEAGSRIVVDDVYDRANGGRGGELYERFRFLAGADPSEHPANRVLVGFDDRGRPGAAGFTLEGQQGNRSRPHTGIFIPPGASRPSGTSPGALAEEMGIHAYRAASGLPVAHPRGGYHSSLGCRPDGPCSVPDNSVDIESHRVRDMNHDPDLVNNHQNRPDVPPPSVGWQQGPRDDRSR